MNNPINAIARSDSYKFSHYLQYPPKTEYVSSYIESRGVEDKFKMGKYAWYEMVFFGLQYYIDTYFSKPLVTTTSLNRMNRRVKQHGLPFNLEGFDYILTKHDGYAPVRVQALKEGTVVPLHCPLVQIMNTDPMVPWITSFVETNTLRVWYPCTVATQSFHIKRMMRDYMDLTCGHQNGLDFKLHDFGPRGVSSSESSMIGGMAHLTCFQGTDNFEALEGCEEYYGMDMAGFSVPASEHSSMTSWGGEPGEILAIENMIDKFGSGIFSVVSDSYDLFHTIDTKFGTVLSDKIKALSATGGKLVSRPDSGDPTMIPVEVFISLEEKFTGYWNEKGHLELPDFLGILQGDGMNQDSILSLLQNMHSEALSVAPLVCGMGGALLQACNRDTMKFAMKASAAQVDGEWRDVFKDPVTDKGKQSKKGRQAVIYTDNVGYQAINEKYLGKHTNLLEDVCVNGIISRRQNMEDIRERINAAL